MAEYRRIRKKNPEILTIDRFGITRIRGGWLIRLGWANKRPKYQKIVKDRDYNGNHIESYLKAASIVKEKRPGYLSTFKRPTNYIKGLCLARQKSKTKGPNGETQYYFCWKLAYVDNKKPRGRTFSFWKTGLIYESFLEAVSFACKFDPDIELEKVDEDFMRYINDVEMDTLQEFLPNSDFKVLDSATDLMILKNRYIKSLNRSSFIGFPQMQVSQAHA